jgi:hypothetical protein
LLEDVRGRSVDFCDKLVVFVAAGDSANAAWIGVAAVELLGDSPETVCDAGKISDGETNSVDAVVAPGCSWCIWAPFCWGK